MKTLFILLWSLSASCLLAQQPQPDTLLSYSLKTGLIDTILPVPVLNAPVLTTSPNPSAVIRGTIDLNDLPAARAGLKFNQMTKAAESMDLTHYPASIHVKIIGYSDGDSVEECSGTMVGLNWVLTSSYCFLTPGTRQWRFDSMKVYPAFDQGSPNPRFLPSQVKTYYAFTQTVRDYHHPAGLLELDYPIGLETGFAGLRSIEDSAYYEETRFHKFSYAREPMPWNDHFQYTNDTVYYSGGNMIWLEELNSISDMGRLGSREPGLLGQSGSPILVQDSTDLEEVYVTGLATWAGNSRHYALSQAVFTQLSAVISGQSTGRAATVLPGYIWVYSSPGADALRLELPEEYLPSQIYLYAPDGERVQSWTNIESTSIKIQRGDLPSGVYLLTVRIGEEPVSSFRLIFE